MAFHLLLDEHYPPWALAELRRRGLDAIGLLEDRPGLCGASDVEILHAAVIEGRVVVTEDVRTFRRAIAVVPDHLGFVFCRSAVFPRTRPGVARLVEALVSLAADPPAGLGTAPLEWWLGADAASPPGR